MKFCHFLWVFIAVLGSTKTVNGQSQEPSTSSAGSSQPASAQAQGSPSGPISSTDTKPITDDDNYEPTSSSTTSSARGQGSATTENGQLSDCKTKPDLETYCSGVMTSQELDFFHSDTSLGGVLAKILTPRTVYALQEQCMPGKWCLPESYQQEITKGKDLFYTTPICQSDNLWSCLESMDLVRQKCNESELFFLMSTIGLMCDMDTIEGGTITTECYTKSLEALHVLFSDMSRNLQNVDKTNPCNDYNKQMVNTYACAVKACDLEQRVFLEDFGPWSNIASIAEDVLESCDMELQCQYGYPTPSTPIAGTTSPQPQNPGGNRSDLEQALDGTSTTDEAWVNQEITEMEEAAIAAEEMIDEIVNELLESTTMSSPYRTTEQSTEGEIVNEQGMDVPDGQSDVDQTFVYGMVTVTAVVVVSLTLIGVMTFKRFSRMRKTYKLGYSQMTEEESRMLRNEYN